MTPSNNDNKVSLTFKIPATVRLVGVTISPLECKLLRDAEPWLTTISQHSGYCQAHIQGAFDKQRFTEQVSGKFMVTGEDMFRSQKHLTKPLVEAYMNSITLWC